MNEVFWAYVYVNVTKGRLEVFYDFSKIASVTKSDSANDKVAILAIDDNCSFYCISPFTIYLLVPHDLSNDYVDDK